MDLKNNEPKNVLEKCPHCNGKGYTIHDVKIIQVCYLCNGWKNVDWITYLRYKGSSNGAKKET